MKAILAIARRELEQYFATPLGWIVLTAFLAVTGFFFAFAVLRYGVTKFRETFINQEDSDIHIGPWWDWAMRLVAFEAVFLAVWFLWSARSDDFRETWTLFSPYNVGSVVIQFVIVLAVLLGLPLDLAGLEAFDAFLLGAAGTASVVVALVGLAASANVPMAYCRYGCATGELLRFLRSHGAADRFGRRDVAAAALLALAIWLDHARDGIRGFIADVL